MSSYQRNIQKIYKQIKIKESLSDLVKDVETDNIKAGVKVSWKDANGKTYYGIVNQTPLWVGAANNEAGYVNINKPNGSKIFIPIKNVTVVNESLDDLVKDVHTDNIEQKLRIGDRVHWQDKNNITYVARIIGPHYDSVNNKAIMKPTKIVIRILGSVNPGMKYNRQNETEVVDINTLVKESLDDLINDVQKDNIKPGVKVSWVGEEGETIIGIVDREEPKYAKDLVWIRIPNIDFVKDGKTYKIAMVEKEKLTIIKESLDDLIQDVQADEDEKGAIFDPEKKSKYWVDNQNQLHRDNDKPAAIYKNGQKEWYQHGKLWRGDDKPSITWHDGSSFWYTDDKLHREGDNPAVVKASGTKEWYKNDLRHRDNGPALIRSNGQQSWYKHGKLHRIDGPAVIRPGHPKDNNPEFEYWINGIQVSPTDMRLNLPRNNPDNNPTDQ